MERNSNQTDQRPSIELKRHRERPSSFDSGSFFFYVFFNARDERRCQSAIEAFRDQKQKKRADQLKGPNQLIKKRLGIAMSNVLISE